MLPVRGLFRLLIVLLLQRVWCQVWLLCFQYNYIDDISADKKIFSWRKLRAIGEQSPPKNRPCFLGDFALQLLNGRQLIKLHHLDNNCLMGVFPAYNQSCCSLSPSAVQLTSLPSMDEYKLERKHPIR